jgi:guanosine-3',5'-bis(diphosphate) 3'-pyrophosphohydrolase
VEEILDKVKDFADKAHGDQTRKYTPERYIVHPIRVMNICREYTDALPVLAASLLHDVLEDTAVTSRDMNQFLVTLLGPQQAARTTKLVEELTDIYTKKNYPNWNRRKRKAKEAERIEKLSPESQTIKYADIIDNCKEIVEYDPEFAGVFIRECRSLLKKMLKGDQELYRIACNTVDECIRRLETK